MLEDVAAGAVLALEHTDAALAEALVRRRQPHFVSWHDWKVIQAIEEAKGEAEGRPRVKITSVEEMLAALDGG